MSGEPAQAVLPESVTFLTVPAVRAIMAGYEAGGQRVVVDMSKVRESDTQGLAPVITAASRLRDTGGWLGIAVPDERTLHLLRTTGLVKRIPVFDTVEDARAAALLSRDGDFQEDDR